MTRALIVAAALFLATCRGGASDEGDGGADATSNVDCQEVQCDSKVQPGAVWCDYGDAGAPSVCYDDADSCEACCGGPGRCLPAP